ncbi:glycosyltransferase family 2 protein [Bacillus gobiensis]|uniref:glycosyltransferase family 2 protein n=1 Tax=Bacillus gobiensis TaxID=1441095 RepID=UPI003D1CC30C
MKISIAVPTYNSERYISRCLDSLIHQSMPDTDYEIICVDDYSNDQTVKILKEYSRTYKQLSLILRSVNSGGPGEPRNEAIQAAKGKYIFFVDSDDYLEEEALERMYTYAEQHQSDIVLGKMKGVNGRAVPAAIFQENLPEADLVQSSLVYAMGPTKLFRLSLLKEHNIFFPSGIQATEDQVFVMKAYLYSKRISVLADYTCYYAVQRDEGEHMTFAYVPPYDYYEAMQAVVDLIKDSHLELNRKEALLAKFMNRHFDFSRTTDFLEMIEEEERQREWMAALHKFIVNYIPESIDSKVHPDHGFKLHLIRTNDFPGLKSFEKELKDLQSFTSIKEGKLVAHFPSLVKANYPKKQLTVNRKNKLQSFLSSIRISHNVIQVSGTAGHSAMKNNELTQMVKAIWIHRETKKEKVFLSDQIINESFVFSMKFDDIAEEPADLGVWDFYIESSIDGYTKRTRAGNQKNPYPYSDHAKYIGNNGHYVYEARPYFTTDTDDLSLELREVSSIEIDVYEEDSFSAVTLEFPDQQLFFPEKSQVFIKCIDFEILVPVKTIKSLPEKTLVRIDKQILRKYMPVFDNHEIRCALSINSQNCWLKPLKESKSVFLYKKSMEKKQSLFKTKKKVEYYLKAENAEFYLSHHS